MMKFPQWVSRSGKQRIVGKALARNRLLYMLKRAALTVDPGASISRIAETVPCSRQNLHLYLDRGSFSIGTASRLEEVFGRDLLRKEHLIFPLDIEATE